MNVPPISREGYEGMILERRLAASTPETVKSSKDECTQPNIMGLDHRRLYRDPDSSVGWSYDAAPR